MYFISIKTTPNPYHIPSLNQTYIPSSPMYSHSIHPSITSFINLNTFYSSFIFPPPFILLSTPLSMANSISNPISTLSIIYFFMFITHFIATSISYSPPFQMYSQIKLTYSYYIIFVVSIYYYYSRSLLNCFGLNSCVSNISNTLIKLSSLSSIIIFLVNTRLCYLVFLTQINNILTLTQSRISIALSNNSQTIIKNICLEGFQK